MRFSLIDRIERIVPSQEIVAIKNLTLAEEYLAEHFPTFPVMPGVLMVEAATQAAAWLVRTSDGFRHSMVLLKELKNARFGTFVTPGRQLRLRLEWVKDEGALTTLKVASEVDGQSGLTARLVVERFNLSDRRPELADDDRENIEHHRRTFRRLLAPGAMTGNGASG